jgi:hypothetical protein
LTEPLARVKAFGHRFSAERPSPPAGCPRLTLETGRHIGLELRLFRRSETALRTALGEFLYTSLVLRVGTELHQLAGSIGGEAAADRFKQAAQQRLV